MFWQILILALVVPHLKLLLKCTFIWSLTITFSAPESCNFVKKKKLSEDNVPYIYLVKYFKYILISAF